MHDPRLDGADAGELEADTSEDPGPEHQPGLLGEHIARYLLEDIGVHVVVKLLIK